MENNISKNSTRIKVEVKTESQDDEINIDQTNTEVDTNTNEKIKIKNEPLEEQAGCSSLKITNYFSVPNISVNNVSAELTSNSLPSILNNSNHSATSLPNGVIKTETEDTSTASGAGSKENDSNGLEIKKDPNDNVLCNSSQPNLPPTKVIKTENTINDVKKEDEDHSSLQDPSNAITNILTSSIPSTSSATNDQSNDVTSSVDQKPSCRYGKNCYRLNELHRRNFHHPPGSDPLKSPEKPRCKYGSRCYRKSEEHRKRFLHDRSPDNAMSNKRKRKVRNTASQTTSHVYESDSDDSLYDESYDGTSDEFHPDDETDSDETDFEPDLDGELLNTD